jgi:hypothetical protein
VNACETVNSWCPAADLEKYSLNGGLHPSTKVAEKQSKKSSVMCKVHGVLLPILA